RIFALGALRAVLVEVEGERDHLALAHQLCRSDDILRLREIQGSDLVIGTPLAPILVFLGGIVQILSGQLSAEHGIFFRLGRLTPMPFARPLCSKNFLQRRKLVSTVAFPGMMELEN